MIVPCTASHEGVGVGKGARLLLAVVLSAAQHFFSRFKKGAIYSKTRFQCQANRQILAWPRQKHPFYPNTRILARKESTAAASAGRRGRRHWRYGRRQRIWDK